MTNPEQQIDFEALAEDVLFLRINSAESEDVNTIATMRDRYAERGPYYIAADFRGMKGNFGKELHQDGPKMVKTEWILGAAYIGASLPLRVMLKVFNLGIFLAGKGDFPYEFVDSDQAALAYFDRLRKERRSGSPGSGKR